MKSLVLMIFISGFSTGLAVAGLLMAVSDYLLGNRIVWWSLPVYVFTLLWGGMALRQVLRKHGLLNR